jgi:hypothetical protein
MAGNYPAGVTDAAIDDLLGPDEPEIEEVITPRDILDRLIEDGCEDGMERRGLAALEGARVYLEREGRLDSDGIYIVAFARFLAEGGEPFREAREEKS